MAREKGEVLGTVAGTEWGTDIEETLRHHHTDLLKFDADEKGAFLIVDGERWQRREPVANVEMVDRDPVDLTQADDSFRAAVLREGTLWSS